MNTNEIKDQLKAFYNHHAIGRSTSIIPDWKKELRLKFLDTINENQCKTLLDLGAGAGVDSIYFRDHNLDVTAIDLSDKHVKIIQDHNIKAYEMDFYNLDFSYEFDAIYSMNSLLHIPKGDLDTVLLNIKSALKDNGYFFICVYGGKSEEGIKNYKNFTGERFFSSYTFTNYKNILKKYFQIEYSKLINLTTYETHCFILKNNK